MSKKSINFAVNNKFFTIMDDLKKYHKHQRSEEIQDIIDRMPTNFGRYIMYIVLFLTSAFFFFGFIVKYPDIVPGKITVNSTAQEVKLVANSNGKLHLFTNDFLTEVNENQPIAYIQNTVDYDTIVKIKQCLAGFLKTPYYTHILPLLPNKITLGELTAPYYEFLTNVEQLRIYETEKPFDVQAANLQSIYKHQQQEIDVFQRRLANNQHYYYYAKKMHNRDSVLFSKATVAEAEMDKSEMTLLQTQNNLVQDKENLTSMEKQAQQTANTMRELTTQKSLKINDLTTNVISSYNRLMEAINKWEQLYIIKSPIAGKVQYLNFWAENQFVNAGTEMFSIIPNQKEISGQMLLPTSGAGKVEVGQEVVVKLDDYPYMEFGSVRGTVASVSLSKKAEKTSQGDVEVYVALIRFDKGLLTNYGKQINTNKATSGTGEIITKDRRLIERLFDNLKYVANK